MVKKSDFSSDNDFFSLAAKNYTFLKSMGSHKGGIDNITNMCSSTNTLVNTTQQTETVDAIVSDNAIRDRRVIVLCLTLTMHSDLTKK